MDETVPLHEDLTPLAFLLGRWRGTGRGEYPTIAPFAYGEEIELWHVGKPWIAYRQRTWALDDGRPLHAEAGYWRPGPGGRVELVLAHPTGIVEVETGRVEATTVRLRSTSVALTPTAKRVDEIERTFQAHGDVLRYTLSMAAVGVPLTRHLTAELRRA